MTEQTKPVRHPLWLVADQLQMDLRAAEAKLVLLRAHLAALTLPATGADPAYHLCPYPDCTYGGSSTTRLELEQHVYLAHNGPLPSLWLLADRRAGDDGKET